MQYNYFTLQDQIKWLLAILLVTSFSLMQDLSFLTFPLFRLSPVKMSQVNEPVQQAVPCGTLGTLITPLMHNFLHYELDASRCKE